MLFFCCLFCTLWSILLKEFVVLYEFYYSANLFMSPEIIRNHIMKLHCQWIDWKYEMLALYILCENISDSKMIFVQLKCIWNTSFNNEFIQLQSEHKWQGWQRLLIINYRLCDSEIHRGVNCFHNIYKLE